MITLTRRDSLLGITALSVLSGCGAGSANLPLRGTQTIPLDLSGPRPTAALMLGDAGPVTAIFDTGAAASVIRLSFAKAAGLPDQGHASAAGPGGQEIPGFRTSITGRLGDAEFAGALAVALDIPLSLPGIDAVISPGVFKGRFVRFDFARAVAEVLDRTPENTPSGQSGGYSGGLNPFNITSLPTTRGEFPGGVTRNVDIDTGSARGLVLPAEMATTLPLAGPLEPAEDLRLIGITRKATKAKIAGVVTLGGLAFDSPEATFGEGMDDAHVGMVLLRSTRIVLDPEGRRTWLMPAS